MICNFKTKIKSKVTLFPEQIINGLVYHNVINSSQAVESVEKLGLAGYKISAVGRYKTKIHTFREDQNNRYQVGKVLQLSINARQKNYCQFVPNLPVQHTQKVVIRYNKKGQMTMKIDGRRLTDVEIEMVAKNDGFESVDHFKQWFNCNWQGKLIHLIPDFKY